VSSDNPVAGDGDLVPDDVLAAGSATAAPGPVGTGEARGPGHDGTLNDGAGHADGGPLASGRVLADSDVPSDGDVLGGGVLGDSDVLGDGDVLEDSDDAGPGLRAALEAIMLVADEPVPEVLLAQVLERPRGEVGTALRELRAEYTAQGRGFDLREVAGGWRFYTRADCAPLVERFVRDGQEVRLTQAALETLAVVAYRQPVSRARVSAVRGVNCDGVMRTLVLRGLVDDFGTDTETGAILYRTTSYFLERMGLTSLADLPDLAPFLPDDFADIEDN
jgi:segregation and condensation protein B